MSPTWFARFNAFADAARGTSYQGAPAHIEVIHRADDGRHGTLYSDHPEGARFRQPPSGVGGDLLRHRRTIVASDGASVASVGDPQACEAFYVVRGTGMRSFDDAENRADAARSARALRVRPGLHDRRRVLGAGPGHLAFRTRRVARDTPHMNRCHHPKGVTLHAPVR
jgi:hypothetical protein